MWHHSSRAFILGLDGVPWSLIDQWTTDGQLPTFARLLEEGVACPLRSTSPATTPLAWPSIATGVRPDKHGIYGFQEVTPGYTKRMNDNTVLQQPALWDMLSPAVVANVPMTYPAPTIDGKLVASIMAPAIDERYTHPSSLAAEITDRIPDYEIALRWGDYVGRESALLADITSLVEARRELLRMLMETDDWRLFFFAFMEPDRLQHLVWDQDVLLAHYRHLDDILAEVIEYVEDKGASLFVVSDHGFGPVSRSVAVNSVLERHGYLERSQQSTVQRVLDEVGINRSGITDAFARLGVDPHDFIRRYLPERYVNAIAANVPGDHALYDLDHDRTTAFVHGFGTLYINDAERFHRGPVAPRNVDQVRRELQELFEGLTDPDTGDRVLDVRDGADLFPTDPRAPDLVLEPRPGYALTNSFSEEVFGQPEANATHRPEGILLAWGESIGGQAELQEASVVDVTPTVLHTVGEPVPENADGTVRSDLYRSDSPPRQRPVETHDYTGDETVDRDDVAQDMDPVKDRLQGLGYLE